VLDARVAPNAQLRTLIHESAHALGVSYRDYPRAQAAVMVDCTAYIVAASVGLDVGGESIPYVAGWGEQDSVEAVTRFAAVIDELAGRLEGVLAGDRAPAPATSTGRRDAGPEIPQDETLPGLRGVLTTSPSTTRCRRARAVRRTAPDRRTSSSGSARRRATSASGSPSFAAWRRRPRLSSAPARSAPPSPSSWHAARSAACRWSTTSRRRAMR